MLYPPSFLRQRFCAVVLLLLCFGMPAQAEGTFRFLTVAMPDGKVGRDYSARVITANAAGPVSFSVSAGTLPAGLTLDSRTGAIYGRPTLGQQAHLTVTADDGSESIDLLLSPFKITSNTALEKDSLTIVTTALTDGRAGLPYLLDVQAQGSAEPLVWGAQDLPAGLEFDGSNGTISGTPLVAGTFDVRFTVNSIGEGKISSKSLSLTIFPADTAVPPVYSFRFETALLNNGEVGTAYSDQYLVEDEDGSVTFSASGLPAGLVLDPATGAVSGTPTVSGTFFPMITATDSHATISTRLPIWITPAATSNFYLNHYGLPVALFGVTYTGSAPILVAARNGSKPTYAAQGLPSGITFNAKTGALGGATGDVGLFPVVYTVTDTTTGEILTMATPFLVLPPGGGEISSMAANLWIRKLSAKVVSETATAPNDSWQALYIYNGDRRSRKSFSPRSHSVSLVLGNSSVEIPSRLISGLASTVYKHRSSRGQQPVVRVKGIPSSQSLSVNVSSTELGIDAFPVDKMSNNIFLGNKVYMLEPHLDPRGKFLVTYPPGKASFVVSSASMKDAGKEKDYAKFSMYLADSSLLADFPFVTCSIALPNCNQPAVRLKLYDGTTVLLDKDLTAMLATTRMEDKDMRPVYKMKKVVKEDPATENILQSFSFDSSKGMMKIAFNNLVLPVSFSTKQVHVGMELKIDNRSYFTSITLFETKSGSKYYRSKFSKYSKS